MVKRVKSLAQSFGYAIRGIILCVKNERNMRIHIVVAAYVLIFSVFYDFSATQHLILLLTIGMVFFAEMVNTAIEALVDLETQSYDSLARIAKDVAAGAVLICAVFAVIVGVILFFKPAVISHIFSFLVHNIFCGVIFLLSLPASGFFIFGLPSGIALFKRKI